MENKIIYNVFSEKELKDIYEAESFKKSSVEIQDFLGRTRLDYINKDLHLLPNSIHLKANDLIKNFSDCNQRNYKFWYLSIVEYNNKFGIPNLGPHRDGCAFAGTILCQIDANTSWDLYVEGIPYMLTNNSALLVNARDQDHWRMNKKFNDGEYIKMVFLHYMDLDDQKENTVTPDQLHEVNMRWAHITGYKESDRTY